MLLEGYQADAPTADAPLNDLGVSWKPWSGKQLERSAGRRSLIIAQLVCFQYVHSYAFSGRGILGSDQETKRPPKAT